jgi:hypothetical protein
MKERIQKRDFHPSQRTAVLIRPPACDALVHLSQRTCITRFPETA